MNGDQENRIHADVDREGPIDLEERAQGWDDVLIGYSGGVHILECEHGGGIEDAYDCGMIDEDERTLAEIFEHEQEHYVDDVNHYAVIDEYLIDER